MAVTATFDTTVEYIYCSCITHGNSYSVVSGQHDILALGCSATVEQFYSEQQNQLHWTEKLRKQTIMQQQGALTSSEKPGASVLTIVPPQNPPDYLGEVGHQTMLHYPPSALFLYMQHT